MSWEEKANCRNAPEDVIDRYFFPSDSVLTIPPEAAEYCEYCPVVAECGKAGGHAEYGVWGGVLKRPGGRKHDGSTKLSESDVRQIKKMMRNGWSNVLIAEEYGVNHSTISHIRTGRRWSNIE